MALIDNFNAFVYDSKDTVIRISSFFSGMFSLCAVVLVIYELGFPLSPIEEIWVLQGFAIIFGYFAFNYFLNLFYTFERIEFLKSSWFEGTVMLFIISSGIYDSYTDLHLFEQIFIQIGIEHSEQIYRVFMTLAMLYFVGFNFVKASTLLNSLTLKPAITFILSFVLLIAIGTGLLMLPQMTTIEGSADFMSAFFTSVSASCVTGLIVQDTATYFTLKGLLVIMFLMQLGGIGMVSFATFFATFMKKGVGLKQQLIIQDYLASESLFSAQGLLRQVVGITLTIEAIASVFIFFSWGTHMHFDSLAQRIFYSVFHGVSAFCNAGFSLFSNGLYEEGIRNSYLLHLVIGVTIVVGGLGFSAVQDLFSPKALQERLHRPWKDWKINTKVAVHTSLMLIIIGMALFFLTEYNGVMKNMGAFESIVSAFFQSITTRTAGFNTVDFSQLKVPTLIFMIFLMFIGASSGSTGGGIKTSTFLLIGNSAIATIRGKKNVDLGKRSISTELLGKAYSIFVFACTFNLVMIFILSVTDPHISIINLVFEQVSAFATVGLSTGITTDLSLAGKLFIVSSMFIGRVGTLTLALALSTRVSSNSFKYPSAHIMIG
jgi:trk system potassium uptake protein TrkH